MFNEPPVPISHGVVIAPAREGVAPLEIITSPGANYYAKLVDLSGRAVMTMYIVGGRRLEVEVPLGSYKLRYCAGDIWYGEQHKFGPGDSTQCSKADDIFEFTRSATGYDGYTVELIMQEGGNLPTSEMDPANF